MKRSIFYFVAIFCFTSLYGQKGNVSEKYIKSIFEAYRYLPEQSDDSGVFWDYIVLNNEQFMKYVNNTSKLAMKTREEFADIINTFDSYPHSHGQVELDLSKSMCGNDYTAFIRGISFEKEEEYNAYALPNGMIYVTERLKNLLIANNNTIGLYGVIAHEIAHCVLLHSEVHMYRAKIKKRNNNRKKIVAGILGGAILSAGMAAYTNSGAMVHESMSNNISTISYGLGSIIEYEFDKNTFKYGFSYSREQEIEADIIACLFLEWMGQDPNSYIQVLEILKEWAPDIPTEKELEYSNHPSFDFRIATLKKYW